MADETNQGDERFAGEAGAQPTRLQAVQKTSMQRDRCEDILTGISMGLDAINLAVTMTDVDGTIIFVNPVEAKLHNRSVDELLGQDLGILAPAGNRRPLSKSQLKELKSWKRESVNLRVVMRDSKP